jgi:hypothetical protein
LDRKQDGLKVAHGIPEKIAVGRVLQPVGLALTLLGLARLVWLLATVRRARSAVMPPIPPNPSRAWNGITIVGRLMAQASGRMGVGATPFASQSGSSARPRPGNTRS